ncbi:MAG TPA: DsrE/DsrF/DrsH-like family protein [Ktedonobacterales bacterium]|nr:DsrE/DsrF/DrsH-like family protein [Ktedonobacterales bacterium]
MATTSVDREHVTLTVDMEQLIRERVDEIAGERINQLVAERVADAMKKDPSKNTVAIIASKGTLDMAYPPLILATAAAAMGEDVEVFFTFYGLEIIKKGGAQHLKVAPIANPAMPVPMPNILGMLPGMTPMATWMMKTQFFGKHNVATIEELLDQCKLLGVKLIACQMTMDVMGIKREDLLDEVEVGGAATFLNFAGEAHTTLFI